MKVALFANEAGGGLGHIGRLAALAAEMKRRGWRTVLSMVRLRYTERFTAAFDSILPAPGWPGTMGEKWFRVLLGPKIRASSYAGILTGFGGGDPRAVAIQLRSWDGMFRLIEPDAVIGDYAPGAMIAAAGRLPSIAVGSGFTVPAVRGGFFQPFRGSAEGEDKALQIKLAEAIAEGAAWPVSPSRRRPLQAFAARHRCRSASGRWMWWPADAAKPSCLPIFFRRAIGSRIGPRRKARSASISGPIRKPSGVCFPF
ncbi:MAG: hypothetical protein HC850_14020 [Rhodomicrobium sp.]|nr:hypothetical protein [Rhodomicrobium sp.]